MGKPSKRSIERLKDKYQTPLPVKEPAPKPEKPKEEFRIEFLNEFHPKYRGKNGR